jgi:hypothetical protein
LWLPAMIRSITPLIRGRCETLAKLLSPACLIIADRSPCRNTAPILDLLFHTARRSLTDKPYWHLFALGTNPSENETEIRGKLIAPVLAEADLKRRSCYVETFQEKDLLFYQQQGFEITGAGQIPKGPSFWVLIRRPFPETGCNLGPRRLVSCKLNATT